MLIVPAQHLSEPSDRPFPTFDRLGGTDTFDLIRDPVDDHLCVVGEDQRADVEFHRELHPSTERGDVVDIGSEAILVIGCLIDGHGEIRSFGGHPVFPQQTCCVSCVKSAMLSRRLMLLSLVVFNVFDVYQKKQFCIFVSLFSCPCCRS